MRGFSFTTYLGVSIDTWLLSYYMWHVPVLFAVVGYKTTPPKSHV